MLEAVKVNNGKTVLTTIKQVKSTVLKNISQALNFKKKLYQLSVKQLFYLSSITSLKALNVCHCNVHAKKPHIIPNDYTYTL